MCGISGIIGPNACESVAKQMANSLSHRGPDGHGLWATTGVALSHRRLSIIDINTGQQPMISASGRWVIVFNGEIYNFKNLKMTSLIDYIYKTSSDTEVILAALDKWGVEGLKHIEGMFAIAVWDVWEKKLILARDPQGIKPLYYCQLEGKTIFASEIKALLAAGARVSVDEDNLGIFLDIRFIPSPRTLFRGIYKLPPGHFLIIDRDGNIGNLTPFSFTAPLINRHVSKTELIEKLENALIMSVERQLVADVPIGILLSGGVDSAAVAAAAVRTGQRVSTFCIGYNEEHSSNEFNEARRTSQLLGTEHYEFVIDSASAIKCMPDVIKHLEEPVVTSSMFSYYLLCREVSKHRKVVLSGQGVDEPWAGYKRHQIAALTPVLSPLFKIIPSYDANLGKFTDVWRRIQEALRPQDDMGRIIGLHSLFPGNERDAIYHKNTYADTCAAIAYAMNAVPENGNMLEKILSFELRTSLPDNLLLVADKLSMAAGLEVRVPMLDPLYLNLVETIPGNLRRNGFVAGNGKVLHKLMCQSLLPAEVVYRQKKGFQSPIEEWLKSDVGDKLISLIEEPGSFTRRYLNFKAVRNITNFGRRGMKGGYERQLFAIWVLEEWFRTFSNLNLH